MVVEVVPPSTPEEEKKQASPSPTSKKILTPKLRRNVSVELDHLEDSTSVQRLVEYFVVVTCQPRWDQNATTAQSPPTPPTPPSRKEPTEAQSKKKEFSDKLNESKKKFNQSFHKAFKGKEMSGTDRAIQHTLSHEEESREEALPPPKPRGTWKRDESEASAGNIHIPQGVSELYTFQPKVTARYPAADHPDNPLNPMITHFCYPVGDVVVPLTEYQMPRIHHFVLTNEKGRKVYGTCVTFYEEYVPPSDTPFRRTDCVHDSADRDIEVTMEDEEETALYLPRCLCILSIWPYVTAFREYLAQLFRLAIATDCMTAPIERYVMNICTEIPAPPPGAFEVQVNILDSVIRFWSPPAKLPIAYVALPYRTLFDCLDVENILHLWYCLTMERKVLLVSSQYSLLTVCSEILCSLLYPMKWSHLYVPVLPRFLCPMLDAPVPYLCGITRENWLHVQQFVSEETIVVDLDRNSLMFGEQTMELPPLPGKKWVKLKNSVNSIAGHMFWQTRGLENEYNLLEKQKMTQWNFKRVARQKGGEMWKEKLETYDQAFNLQFTPDSENLRTEDSIEQERSQWDRLQEAFLRFFVAMLKDYRGFLHVPEAGTPLSPTPGANDWIKWSKRRYFDREGFLDFQKPQYLPYLSELCSTQQFDDFITKRLYTPEMPDIIFFDQSIDAKLNRSSLRFSKVDTPFLQSAKAHKVLKSFLAVEPNSSNLPTDGPFVYETWPATFDPTLFCKPRPIPNIITAEFDRQASLISRLRRNHSPAKDGDKEVMLFYGSDFDLSPEGMAFTVYFFTYSAVIGREWRDYQVKRRELDMVSKGLDSTPIEDFEIQKAEESQASLGVCEDCSPQEQVVANVIDCSPCPQYADQLNCQAQEAYNVITQFAMTPFEMMHLPTSGSLLDDDEGLAEYEEAREVAIAQLDLAFDTLRAMEARGHLCDPDIFKSLMEACGRCGDTKRALGLIEMMKRDGVADGEVLSCFMAAFCHGGDTSIDSVQDGVRGSDAYSDLLRKKLEAVGGTPKFGAFHSGLLSDSESEAAYSDFLSESGSEASESSSIGRKASLIEWFGVAPPQNPMMKKKKKRKKRKKKKNISEEWAVTDRLSKQIVLGESLLEFLYPELSLDTQGDVCPQCSYRMTENEIVDGWLPCEFQDYTTACSKCEHRFVPKFSVSCNSPTFEGSQGLGTPLYCEFLSPWVLRKELNHIISVADGIDIILNPEWRAGRDIQATLWWNLIVMYRRHELPFSFLLQGSFKNRLINPVPQD